jgi:hypothetical protein
LGVLLGHGGELLGDLSNVGQTPAVVLRVGQSLGFVADQVVDVGDDFVELVLEELGDERGGEGEDEGLYNQPSFRDCERAKDCPTLLFAAASPARARIAGTETVRW